MSVRQMEQRFHELEERRKVGEIDDEQFATEVKKLQFRDGQGQLWRISSTGQWYYEEKGRWVRGEPPRKFEGPSKTTMRVVLLAAGILVIALIIAGILAGPVRPPGPETLTAAALAEIATPTPTYTPTPALPTDTPTPIHTPTPALPTDTPTPTHTPTPVLPTDTPTPTHTPTPVLPIDTPTPTNTPKIIAGKIAFPVFDPKRGTYDIFIANADGTGRRKIKEEASQPCFNPEGTWIAYRSWRSDRRGLSVVDTVSGDDLWTITDAPETSRPSVSKGGIVYHRRQSLDSPVYIYLFSGNEEPEVIRWGGRPLPGESPAWVSGERLVYKGCIGGACGLYLTKSADKGTDITPITDNVSDTNPEASPDGKKIAFMSRRDLNWEIYVMDLDSYTVERLTANAADDGLPIWSPDGWTIAFASDRSGEWAIWAMNPDGSNQRMLFPLGGSLHGYVFNAPLNERGGWEEERLSWSP